MIRAVEQLLKIELRQEFDKPTRMPWTMSELAAEEFENINLMVEIPAAGDIHGELDIEMDDAGDYVITTRGTTSSTTTPKASRTTPGPSQLHQHKFFWSDKTHHAGDPHDKHVEEMISVEVHERHMETETGQVPKHYNILY